MYAIRGNRVQDREATRDEQALRLQNRPEYLLDDLTSFGITVETKAFSSSA